MKDDLSTMLSVLTCTHTYVCPDRDRAISREEAEQWIRARVSEAKHWQAQFREADKKLAALTPSPDHADLIGRANKHAEYQEAWAADIRKMNGASVDADNADDNARTLRALIASLSRVEGARETTADIDLPALRNWLREKGDVVAGIFPPQPISCANYLNAQRALGALINCLSRASADQTDGGDGL